MVLVGHAQRLSQPLTRMQRRLVAAVVIIVVGASAWAITQAASAPASRNGCVNLVVPGSMGGGVLSHCGAAARSWCASEYRQSDPLALLAAVQCRLAGIARAGGGPR
jgi:hypothetical protein